jgi:hypothetical protein
MCTFFDESSASEEFPPKLLVLPITLMLPAVVLDVVAHALLLRPTKPSGQITAHTS